MIEGETQLKHMITLGFLIAACTMYAYGEVIGSGILFFLGCVSEMIFWKRVQNLRKSKKSAAA
jgi:hypothetical protein